MELQDIDIQGLLDVVERAISERRYGDVICLSEVEAWRRQDPTLLAKVGLAYAALKQNIEAEASLLACLRSEPKNHLALAHLIRLYVSEARHSAALELLGNTFGPPIEGNSFAKKMLGLINANQTTQTFDRESKIKHETQRHEAVKRCEATLRQRSAELANPKPCCASDANEEPVNVEYVAYVLGGFGAIVGTHPQFAHIDIPPEGYRFTVEMLADCKHKAMMQDLVVTLDFRFPPPITTDPAANTVLAEAFRIARVALDRGASELNVTKFLVRRNLPFSARIPSNCQLAFLPSFPLAITSVPWVIEIEDSTTLLYPNLLNGETSTANARDLESYQMIKAVLESDTCRAIITHVDSTAETVPILFESESIREKTVSFPIGVQLPDISAKKRAKEERTINLLFTNSWHQSGVGFYLRGGLDILEAFSILAEEYPHLHLTIRSALPSLNKKHVRLMVSHPRIRRLTRPVSAEAMHELMLSSDICLLPAARLHVVATVKAMAYGLPVVASDGWGFSEYITDGHDGILLPGRYGVCSWIDQDNGMLREDYSSIKHPDGADPKIVDGLVDALSQLIEDDRLRRRMGENARRTAEEKYTMERWNKNLKSVFDQINSCGRFSIDEWRGHAN